MRNLTTTIRHIIAKTRRNPSILWSLIALSVYTVAALVMTYPTPVRLNSVIIGEERGDAYQYAWSLWWAKQALFEPDKGLARLTLMNHPVGVEHPYMLTLIGVNLGRQVHVLGKARLNQLTPRTAGAHL